MTTWQTATSKWTTIKPTVIGLAIGLVAGPLISNYLGWQVTSSSAQTQLRDGVVETQAAFCNTWARAAVAEPGKLDWNARTELAKKWAVMPGSTAAESDVTSACARKLAG